jgi:glycosyltransferase involved in cell wall biosynthesis
VATTGRGGHSGSVAIVHEWFGATGGSEQVFLSIGDTFPQARRFVLWQDPDAEPPVPLQQSWLGRTPLRRSKALALPLMPVTWRTLTRRHFDLVISSSHAFAHTVRLGGADTVHLSYIHSPARYLWSPAFDGRGANPLLSVPRRALQAVDKRMSRHVNSYAANSQEVRGRIQRYWQRDAWVIHPPVDVEYFAAAPKEQREQPRDYLLGIGRWIAYKNFDLIIEIAAAARLPLIVAGSGPEEARLRKLAEKMPNQVTFETRPSRERLRELYWGARALLFPAHEDFGMIPVEAQACGTPVIGLARGGLLETVAEGTTGFLTPELTPRAYADLVARLGELRAEDAMAHSAQFSEAVFRKRILEWVSHETGSAT